MKTVYVLGKTIFIIVAILIGTGFNDQRNQNTSLLFQEYKKEIDQWHQQRIAELKKEHGWLSLVELDLLEEGKNTIPSVGTVTVKGERLFVELKNEIHATLNGKPFISGFIKPEKDKILFGSRAVAIIQRKAKFAVRIWDSESPDRKNFTGVDRYPVSNEWKVEARWEKYIPEKKIEIETHVAGISEDGVVPGVAVFTYQGKEFRLEPTFNESDSTYFFVFADKTNGRDTYGGGRFLNAELPKDGKIILDFNKARNPPCAFTYFAACPKPQKENILPIKIESGEKKYTHK